jgi:O-antigen/teichoic acid export membrane protein
VTDRSGGRDSAAVDSRAEDGISETSTRRASPSRQRVVGDVGVQILGKALLVLVSVVITAILVRSLGYKHYGQWATLLAILQITGSLGQLGLQQTTVRQITLHPHDEAEYLGTVLVIECLIAVPLALLCATTSGLLATNGTMVMAGFLLSASLLGTAPQIVALVFQARVRNDLTVVASTVNTVLWSAVVIFVARRGGSMIAYAVGYLIVYTFTAALQIAMARMLSPFRFSRFRQLSVPMIRTGLPLGLAVLLYLSYSRIDQVFVFRLAGDRASSLYGAVFRILDQAQFIPLSLMTTMFPLLVAALHDPPRLKRLVGRTSEYMYLLAVPALAFGIAAGKPVVVFLFGSSFAAAGPALSLLMVTNVLLSYEFLYSQLLVAMNLQSSFMRFALAGLVVNVVLNLLLVPRFGFMAAAAITVVTQGLVLGLSVRRTPRDARALPRPRIMWGCLAAAGAMTAAVVVLRVIDASVLLMLAIAPTVYVAAIAGFRVVRAADIRELGQGGLG